MKIPFISVLLIACLAVSSCALFRQPLDKWSGFSNHLVKIEKLIRKGQWRDAAIYLPKAVHAWKRIKPFLQVDIDHDYVNDIEADFIRLKGNIETEDKSDSLENILLIRDNWKNIGSM
ncbi:MAG: DUF4363 family protein [Firmicutes bacterium]|nr:DUF4363 family protein [Bacillota bacterium]